MRLHQECTWCVIALTHVELILVPLGAFDMPVNTPVTWGQEFHRYRQSDQFKRFIRESGVYAYWLEKGFPVHCQSVGSDDFRCD